MAARRRLGIAAFPLRGRPKKTIEWQASLDLWKLLNRRALAGGGGMVRGSPCSMIIGRYSEMTVALIAYALRPAA